jgi:hypothetical protein
VSGREKTLSRLAGSLKRRTLGPLRWLALGYFCKNVRQPLKQTASATTPCRSPSGHYTGGTGISCQPARATLRTVDGHSHQHPRRVTSAQGLVGRPSPPPSEHRQVSPETMATRHPTTNMSITSQHVSIVEDTPIDQGLLAGHATSGPLPTGTLTRCVAREAQRGRLSAIWTAKRYNHARALCARV